MYAKDISHVFIDLLEDYRKYAIPEMIGSSSSLLSNRSTINPISYSQRVSDIRERAEQIIAENSLHRMPAEYVKMLEESEFGPVLPSRLARLVLHSVQSDPSRGSPSSELDYFNRLLLEKTNRLSNYVDVVAGLPVKDYNAGPNEITLRVTLADRTFEHDLEHMSKAFIDFDKFIATVIDIYAHGHEKPKIKQVTGGSVIAMLVCSAIVAQSVISMFSAIVDATAQTVNFLKAANILKTGGGELLISQEQIDAAAQRFLESAVMTQSRILDAEIAEKMSPDNRTRIVMTSTLLVEHVKQGSRISLGHVFDKQMAQIDDVAEVNGLTAEKLIEQSRNIEIKIDDIAAQLDPVPQIAGPESPEDGFSGGSDVTAV